MAAIEGVLSTTHLVPGDKVELKTVGVPGAHEALEQLGPLDVDLVPTSASSDGWCGSADSTLLGKMQWRSGGCPRIRCAGSSTGRLILRPRDTADAALMLADRSKGSAADADGRRPGTGNHWPIRELPASRQRGGHLADSSLALGRSGCRWSSGPRRLGSCRCQAPSLADREGELFRVVGRYESGGTSLHGISPGQDLKSHRGAALLGVGSSNKGKASAGVYAVAWSAFRSPTTVFVATPLPYNCVVTRIRLTNGWVDCMTLAMGRMSSKCSNQLR
jgi:hypothetical protein